MTGLVFICVVMSYAVRVAKATGLKVKKKFGGKTINSANPYFG